MKQNNHTYPCVLDFKPGFFLSWVLYKLFKRVQFDRNVTEQLKQMHKNGVVVYAIKYRGGLDYLLYHFRFRLARIPYPKMAFDLNMSLVLPLSHLFRVLRFQFLYFLKNRRLPNPYRTGFFRQAIREGTTSLICLVDPRGFLRRFIHSEKDNLAFLLEMQSELDRPIYVVPQLVLYKKTPEKEHGSFLDIFFGFKDNPGVIRKIVLFFRHNRKAFIDFGPPLDLKAFLETQDTEGSLEEMASEVRKELIRRIDQQKRVILGPVMKSRQQLKEIVLTDPEINLLLREISKTKKKSLKQNRKKASEYFDEIAADYNIAYVQFFLMVLAWLWKKIFEGIDVDPDEMTVLRESARKGVPIYVPSHKSHVDYLVLNYILLQHHMHVPRIAAGKNLAFWPMGHLFRKSGAFFIRRTFRGARLYSSIFSRYIKALLAEGHPLEFFIEGGRSRSGKLILPKIGFLSILLEAYKEGYCDDLMFVPGSISYDRILEEKSYERELSGQEKKKEGFRQMVQARQFLKRKYGKIYIRFARPISLKAYLAETAYPLESVNQELAFNIIRSINRVSLVTPIALVATAVLTKHRRGFKPSDLLSTVETILAFLVYEETPAVATLAEPEKAVREALALMTAWKVLTSMEPVEDEEPYFYAGDEKKGELAYYKNSIIHFFVPHAFVAISLLSSKEESVSQDTIVGDYAFLAYLFRKEFILEEIPEPPEKIHRVLEYFLQAGFVKRAEDSKGYELTKLGLDKIPIWSNQIRSFLESYWLSTKALLDDKGKTKKKTERLKRIKSLATKFKKLGLIEFQESISLINFQNALSFLEEEVRSMRKAEKTTYEDALETLSHLSRRIYALSHYAD